MLATNGVDTISITSDAQSLVSGRHLGRQVLLGTILEPLIFLWKTSDIKQVPQHPTGKFVSATAGVSAPSMLNTMAPVSCLD